jgi:hypothetical protein
MAVAAYARRPVASAAMSRTRPVTRGRSWAWPWRTTDGPAPSARPARAGPRWAHLPGRPWPRPAPPGRHPRPCGRRPPRARRPGLAVPPGPRRSGRAPVPFVRRSRAGRTPPDQAGSTQLSPRATNGGPSGAVDPARRPAAASTPTCPVTSSPSPDASQTVNAFVHELDVRVHDGSSKLGPGHVNPHTAAGATGSQVIKKPSSAERTFQRALRIVTRASPTPISTAARPALNATIIANPRTGAVQPDREDQDGTPRRGATADRDGSGVFAA